jgi:hypothetical protein
MDFLPIVEGRSCGTCTKCCEGHLRADIKLKNDTPLAFMGQDEEGFKPCPFVKVGEGCSAYDVRPDHPCSVFKCDWLTNEEMPESFKPSRSNTIFTTRIMKGIEYTMLIEAGRKLDSEVLSWAISDALANGTNLAWRVLDNIFWVGNEEFNQMMDTDYPLLTAVSANGEDIHR